MVFLKKGGGSSRELACFGVIHKLREQDGEGGVSKIFTLLYNPYRVKWFTRGGGGCKKVQNLVDVVCE